ncbi:hypothetical protein [Naasia aerilata]|uniref:Thioredoxin domain-containing protein n=1 Tax=Naasia aerilata TaxID=1162966 RepID=A0ABM8G9D2_9MICO|nr:hypothetical protein GCM10025866_06450 [Naasia aerilata]
MGAALEALLRLEGGGSALLLVGEADVELDREARGSALDVVASVTDAQATAFADAGFGLFAERASRNGRALAYLCEGFVCRLPVDRADKLHDALAQAS